MFHPQGPTFLELARQALSSTEQGYNLLAPKFDFTPFRTHDDVLSRIPPILGSEDSIDSALDVCCGTGAGMQMLLPLCSRRLVGIDMSQGMLDVARERIDCTRQSLTIEWTRGNVLEMPFGEEFDVAVCFGALGHIRARDELTFMRQVYLSLRPGGRFVFVTSRMPPFWSHQYLLSRCFNGAMRLRNLFLRPSFVMYYLTFLAPECCKKLESIGFVCDERSGLFPHPYERARLIIATKP